AKARIALGFSGWSAWCGTLRGCWTGRDRMIVSPTQAKSMATDMAAHRLASLDSRIEARKADLETTWRGRRRLRYIDREIKRAAVAGESSVIVGQWSYVDAHAVARYLHECEFGTSVDSLTLGGSLS